MTRPPTAPPPKTRSRSWRTRMRALRQKVVTAFTEGGDVGVEILVEIRRMLVEEEDAADVGHHENDESRSDKYTELRIVGAAHGADSVALAETKIPAAG